MLQTFPPGRVLVVSNSAGTPKDPDGIAVSLYSSPRSSISSSHPSFSACHMSWSKLTLQAEAVSLNLQTPVLVRKTPKPGCAPEIISYFRGGLGKPTTLRGKIHDQIEQIRDIEKTDEKELLEKWVKEVETEPILAHGRPKKGEKGNKSLEGRMVDEQKSTKPASPSPPLDMETTGAGLNTAESSKGGKEDVLAQKQQEDLRILVIGDRLFTDTLLAHRLSRYLPSKDERNVLSIHTTLLPQPNDVRFLRWIEEKLSRGRLREGQTDWGRYVRDPYGGVPRLSEIEAVPRLTWKERWNDLKGDVRESRLHWDPRTWTAFDLTVGAGRGIVWIERQSLRFMRRGLDFIIKRAKSTRRKETPVSIEPPKGTPPSTDSINA